MAPEQVKGEKLTELVDAPRCSLESFLFELFTGRKPIAGDTVERIFYSILSEPLDLAPLLTAGAPQAVIDLVAACTAKAPADRPQDFRRDRRDRSSGYGGTSISATSRDPAGDSRARASGVAAACVRPGCFPKSRFSPYWWEWDYSSPSASIPSLTKPPALAKVLSTSTGSMVLVPAGEFGFGGDKQRISLPAFYIDRTEVPNAEYAKFCRATSRPLPEGFAADRPDYPVVNVTIADARAFAGWAGKRLPNPAEWEKAARGADGRTFPWGNEHDPSRANVGTHELRPVKDFAGGASPFGALQMVGNVWEFVDQLADAVTRRL